MIDRGDWLRCPDLEAAGGVSHGFFGRKGGTSRGAFSTLNTGLGNDDDRDAVTENRQRIADSLGDPLLPLLSAKQRHTADAMRVDAPWTSDAIPVVDGLVTTREDVMIGVVTADCAPILFSDPANRVIGACHAGWRGAVSGIIEATLDCMEECGASRKSILATVGPCIAQTSYEVSQSFRNDVILRHRNAETFFQNGKDSDHVQFDLSGFCAWRLQESGVTRSCELGVDTYQSEDSFFSYRRTTHAGGGAFGVQMSAIRLL